MTFPEIDVVINAAYGGFTVTREMAEWLIANRGWSVVREADYDYATRTPACRLIESRWGYGLPPGTRDDIAFRSDPDLVACVRELRKRRADAGRADKRDDPLHDLRIVRVTVAMEIEDYNDGHERVNAYGLVRDEDD